MAQNESRDQDRNQAGGTGVPPVQGEKISRRHLPHWQREGAVYFLTWRCAKAVELSEAERDMVMSAIRHWDGKRWKVYAAVVMPDHVHLLALPLAKGDGVWELGELLHSVKSYSAHQIAKARKDRRDAGPTIPEGGTAGGTGVSPVGPIWQDERYDRWVRDEDEFAEKWQYIADNPVKAELATTAAEYRWLYLLEEVPR
jgi:REP element-mobilizing transposase RayT